MNMQFFWRGMTARPHLLPRPSARPRSPGSLPRAAPLTARKFSILICWSGWISPSSRPTAMPRPMPRSCNGEDAVERRMREISYLHLTRFVQFLLDRKDRMSMAVGLEVRVPFCDHRLVDYVFNIPWHLRTFDGREKSILRAATRELLPSSIVERQKNPYPSTQDPAYEQAVRADVTEILEDRSHPATPLLNRTAIEDILARPLGNSSSLPGRAGLERARSINSWVKDYGVALDV
jgi:asparagine synthase (glutamine-hydrolysing)